MEEQQSSNNNSQQQENKSNKQGSKFRLEDFFEDDGFAITAAVVDPIIKDGVSKYAAYNVKGEDKNGTFEFYRRYNDFNLLRNIMVKRWPGVFIPPLPPKQATGNLDPEFIQDRRYFLDLFVNEMAKNKHLWYSEEFQVFIRTTNPDLEKAFSGLQKIYHDDIIQKYQNVFASLQGKILNPDLELKINSFNLFLKKIKGHLEKYRQYVKQLMTSRFYHNQDFEKFLTFLLPQYEQTCLKEYLGNIVDGKYVFDENEQKLSQIIEKIKSITQENRFIILNNLLKSEIYEVESFIECIESLYHYEQHKKVEESKIREHEKLQIKASEGKGGGFKGLFSKKSNEQRAQDEQLKVDMHKGMLDKISQILDLIKVILGYIEIDKYKQDKVAVYYKTIKEIAHYESEMSKIKQELWQFVIDNDNIGNLESALN